MRWRRRRHRTTVAAAVAGDEGAAFAGGYPRCCHTALASSQRWRAWAAGEVLGLDFETTGVDRFNDVPVSYALVWCPGAWWCGAGRA